MIRSNASVCGRALLAAITILFFTIAFFFEVNRSSAAGTADVALAQQDPDFAVQGEYVGVDQAMQAIAMGDGDFDLVIYEGGLPGAGAKSNPRRIQSDIDTVKGLIDSMGLTRVERKSPTLMRQPPSGAIVLFDGTQASVDDHWDGGKLSDEGWLMPGTTSKQSFQDYQFHAEFRTPWAPDRTGQGRGNSGIYHQARYETQILDSFGLEGLDNETGGIYTVSAPTVNTCFPPLTWQTYDVEFTAPGYNDAGDKTANARMTVRLNGILVQNDVEVPSATLASKLQEGTDSGPIYLQDHNDPVRFRNIWIAPRDADREAARPIVPGFERFLATQSTSVADAGHLLIKNLACNACHADTSDRVSLIPQQKGPDLSVVAGRVRHDALVAMIRDPHTTKPNTTMPDPWPGADEPTRQINAEQIASYLVLQGHGKIVDRYVGQSQIDRGNELYHRVGCVACHASFTGNPTPSATTVPMGDVHLKYTVGSLATFLRTCNQIRPGIRMPALVGSPAEAIAIAAYLTAETTQGENQGKLVRKLYRGDWDKLPNFSELPVVDTQRVSGFEIQDIQPRNRFAVVFEGSVSLESDGDYTFFVRSDDGAAIEIAGNRLDNDGIHPANTKQATFKLTAGIHPIRVEYFDYLGDSELKVEMSDPQFGRDDLSAWIVDDSVDQKTLDLLPSRFEPKPASVASGRTLFSQSGCVNCHALDDPSLSGTATNISAKGLAMSQLNVERGCLAADVRSPAVDYHLGMDQVAAIKAAIVSIKSNADSTQPKTNTSEDLESNIHLTLAALNCYACHVRNQIGGPEPSRDDRFITTVPEMGWEGRIPPSLDGVGDKLNDVYLASVLDNGSNARDYMLTRMPAFDHTQLIPLIDAIIKSDRIDEMTSIQTPLTHEQVLFNGRKLCGDEGLSCIKCHSFGGNKGGGLGAIDMLNMPERLRQSWFQRYLQDPTKYRPGTRMPNSFADGRSAITDINDGDPALQIDAMWKYLSLGADAKEPLGLNQAAIVLRATQRPRIYRNFFTDISSRGIGVGYPIGVNLLWDAENMTLSEIWKNDFIDASLHWVGRGAGRQKPQGDKLIKVDLSTPIAHLESIDAPWPTTPARDRGYQFLGYRLDQDGNPSFGYRFDDNLIQDDPIPIQNGFRRHFIIKAKEPLVMQFATGSIQSGPDGYRVNDQVTITIEGIETQIVPNDGGTALRAMIPAATDAQDFPITITQTIVW